jgi:NADH-quinone oxidoreductase subunit G
VRHHVDPFSLLKGFTVVQDICLTETALAADVVLPAASAYEKSGTFTNTCGDLQLLSPASEITGVKSDFEIIVRIAERMQYPLKDLVPFGEGVRTDMGQSRGAQSGEADRHAVWLAERGLTPKMSPFDPMALHDEIERIVPGYAVSRLSLLAGTDIHTTAIECGHGGANDDPSLIAPAHDSLFTAGTMGRQSTILNSVTESSRATKGDCLAAD